MLVPLAESCALERLGTELIPMIVQSVGDSLPVALVMATTVEGMIRCSDVMGGIFFKPHTQLPPTQRDRFALPFESNAAALDEENAVEVVTPEPVSPPSLTGALQSMWSEGCACAVKNITGIARQVVVWTHDVKTNALNTVEVLMHS